MISTGPQRKNTLPAPSHDKADQAHRGQRRCDAQAPFPERRKGIQETTLELADAHLGSDCAPQLTEPLLQLHHPLALAITLCTRRLGVALEHCHALASRVDVVTERHDAPASPPRARAA
jgi:hypothetical protein